MEPVMKKETCTSVVQRTLIAADDFLTATHLQILTGLTMSQVAASLHHLKRHRAIDTLEGAGTLWWYATPDQDDRSRILEERTPESRPRKPRKRKVKS
jgi:hypothetical protein